MVRRAGTHGASSSGCCRWAGPTRPDRTTWPADSSAPATAFEWNDDIVLRAPDETVVLARTPQGELQVARFAPTVWGVQLHPEVDVHILEQSAEEDRHRYDDGVLEDVLRRIDARYDDLVAGWRPLAQAFAALP